MDTVVPRHGSVILFFGFSLAVDTQRGKTTCPGVPPRGNECSFTKTVVDGVEYDSLVPVSGTLGIDVSSDVIIRQLHNEAVDDLDVRYGVRTFRDTFDNPDTVSYWGGWGRKSVFFVRGSDFPSLFDSVFAGAFGNLYSGRPPEDQDLGATWHGLMVGRTNTDHVEVDGRSKVEYDFTNHRVGVKFTEIAASAGGSYSGPPMISWKDVPQNSDGSFYIPGYGNDKDSTNPHPTLGYIDGDFYGNTSDCMGCEVAGVFEYGDLLGAFGGRRMKDVPPRTR